MQHNFRDTKVFIPGIYKAIPAKVIVGQHWNGFALPFFPAESVGMIIDQTEAYLREHPDAEPDTERISWRDDEVLHEIPQYPEEEPVVMTPQMIDGVPHWPVGAWAWTWEDADRP